MARQRKIVAIDCETDPFKHGRVPEPFIWGAYDGLDFTVYNDAAELLAAFRDKNVILFAHNGGKFDFMFMLQYIEQCRARIIKNRIVEIKIGNALLRDSWSIIPIALREYRKDEIEYWKLEREHRKKHHGEILRYLQTDCISLYELVARYFDIAGRKPTIASNALAFARSQGINVGRTNRRYDAEFRPYYYGGRCQAFRAGEFRNVECYDIVSAYPFAMMHQHPTGTETDKATTLRGLKDADITRSFIDLTCNSAGAFPKSVNSGLTFPHTRDRFKITGWEYLAAKRHGIISDEEIHLVTTFKHTIDFQPYVSHWFNIKQDAKERNDKAEYIIGKIMMNSLYGKLSQNPIHYCDYKIYPAGTEIDLENGWKHDRSFGELELHSRDALYNIKKRATEAGTDWETYPIHYNVATGASITGFARAHLLDAIHKIGAKYVLYCDTDCVFVAKGGDVSGLNKDGSLGSWEYEGTASPAIIAGKKLYALNFTAGPAASKPDRLKIRAKGSPEKMVKIDDIRALIKGETLQFKFDAPTFSIGQKPLFLVRKLRATVALSNDQKEL